ncbi:LysM peptidoglycan-binding domain-containing protein [Bacillus sp. OK048]|uniref:LysM peptidoglycan-binding domain-containing protein n=1 Tax=Bacillus sp. OK048 TaxID=1882761 RepID=UPI000880B11A|nr:LysM peptidoglycan-binding domain-containing protein [Bacillus sp. OK048]SDM46657.1 LysM domain-containing protein [Bacillus sp. OK048]
MNKEEPFRHQAERLKQRIEKINEETVEPREQLPPREQIHREKRKKTKWKIKYPIIRILVLFFILLPIAIFSAYSYLEGGKSKGPEKVSGDSSGYEVINFEKSETDSNNEKKAENEKDISTEVEPEEKIEVLQPDSSDTQVESPASEQGAEENSGISTETTESAAPQSNSIIGSETVIFHTVKKGENLYRISLKYFQSKNGEEIIRKANNLKGNEIFLGQVLEIPLSK